MKNVSYANKHYFREDELMSVYELRFFTTYKQQKKQRDRLNFWGVPFLVDVNDGSLIVMRIDLENSLLKVKRDDWLSRVYRDEYFRVALNNKFTAGLPPSRVKQIEGQRAIEKW